MKKLLGITAGAVMDFSATQASALVMVRWDMNKTDTLAITGPATFNYATDFGVSAIFGKSSCLAGFACEAPFPGVNTQTGRAGEIEAFNGAQLNFATVQTNSLLGIFSGFDVPGYFHNHGAGFPNPMRINLALHDATSNTWNTIFTKDVGAGAFGCVGWGLSDPSFSPGCNTGSDIANWGGVTSSSLSPLWDGQSGTLLGAKPGSIALGGTFLIDGLRLFATDLSGNAFAAQDAFHLGEYFVDFAFQGDIVPAPGALALIGFGLLGLGAIRRRVK